MEKKHTFQIPVMGIGFTIDTPFKVAPFGISSVLSLGDDLLAERMRAFYCNKMDIPYIEIAKDDLDKRAKRITLYLNVMNRMVKNKFQELKSASFEKGSDLTKYFEMLPDMSDLKKEYKRMTEETDSTVVEKIQQWLRDNMEPGAIDVNIMTKLDKANFLKGEQLPQDMNDAHAALRGFAQSDLTSGVVLSAGLSPRLYSYVANFDVFFPDENEQLNKTIILKVSDYRSALVQGKFLAKKGIWVTEYRVESGLNCGGHAFATDGFLMGPILEEFKQKKAELIEQVHQVLDDALEGLGRKRLSKPLDLLVTAQGGVGTANEHYLLLDNYNVDLVGWGTPFLLVPEAVNIDAESFKILSKAGTEELYLSNISPIGVPFNSVKGNTKDIEKEGKVAGGKPGSTCPSQFLKIYNTEFTDKPICVASRQYQKLKIIELEGQNLPEAEHQKAYDKITVKSCICAGLVMTAYSENDLLKRADGTGVSLCPGPNLAYFSKESTLHEMVDHIYGRGNVLNDTYRPHMFVKELGMYIDYLNKEIIEEPLQSLNAKRVKYFIGFKANLNSGIEYYEDLLTGMKGESDSIKSKFKEELASYKVIVTDIVLPKLETI
tara:strand:- start:2131 stop:3942 length:1812 start_codon:yes stop_codon:yes gene_type:complete